MVVDFRRAQSDHSPLFIDGSPVEIVKSSKFLGVHLAENFTWSINTTSITRKAQQRLYFLRRLRKAHLPPPILTMFYRGTIKSILSSCITAWFGNCTVLDCKTLQQIVRTAEKISGVSLPSITDMYTIRCIRKSNSIVDDPTHPSHTLFTLLPSGKRHKRLTCPHMGHVEGLADVGMEAGEVAGAAAGEVVNQEELTGHAKRFRRAGINRVKNLRSGNNWKTAKELCTETRVLSAHLMQRLLGEVVSALPSRFREALVRDPGRSNEPPPPYQSLQ
ncbi:hypothetical protein QTP70_006877 [Hemibagrus guttatus]|uniref:Alkylated DNA repair protein AlkB homologue 8 N-terminal domain-containing protein n=1 Tax=Hemibagrus guttatus TaxID=175788 RepID=A0AAE0VCT6_9TELE|nr:hypothetical protein QTP70_006877 [Hemibagrus guttatus]